MSNNTKLQYLANHARSNLLPGIRDLVSSPKKSKKTSKRKHRKSSSSRGRVNNTFNQFLDATRFVRNTIKYIFIIWALVLGVYVLFYFASQAAWQPPSTEQGNAIAEIPVTPATTTPGTENSEGITIASNQEPIVTKKLAITEGTNPEPTVVALNAEPELIVLPPPIVVSPEPKPVTSATPANDGSALKVTAYRAMLFDSLDHEDAKQTHLDKDSTVLFIERRGEWIKVTVPGTQLNGYVHSSQVIAD